MDETEWKKVRLAECQRMKRGTKGRKDGLKNGKKKVERVKGIKGMERETG
jgi:hypothetical protein